LIPAKEHPFGKPLIDFWDRYEMCSILCKSNPSLSVVNSEEKYTVDFLENLKQRFPYYSPALIIGSDILEEREDWKNWDRIEELAEIIVVPRSGYSFLDDIKLPDISSTEIRKRLREGVDVSKFVPKNVLEYIKHNNLEF
jgi:nicotinate-nucleotide adenylyltransferase